MTAAVSTALLHVLLSLPLVLGRAGSVCGVPRHAAVTAAFLPPLLWLTGGISLAVKLKNGAMSQES